MAVRTTQLLVVLFWLASMSWLVAAKVMPSMVGGDPPDYQSRLLAPPLAPDCWQVKWNERTIGYAASRVVRDVGEGTALRSVVHFERLPLESMVRQLFGALSFLVRPLFGGGGDLEVEMLVATQVDFDAQRRPQQFRSVIDVNQLLGLLTVEGRLDEAQNLDVVARLSAEAASGTEAQREIFRHSLHLPQEILLSDSIAPRPELQHLRIGQSWTVPVYRAFPPNQPVQLVQATVTRHEIIFWEGSDIETLLVEYHSDSGADIQAARGTLGREWVRSDGMIVRQEVSLSGMRIQFERISDPWRDARIQWLDVQAHPRLWKRVSDD